MNRFFLPLLLAVPLGISFAAPVKPKVVAPSKTETTPAKPKVIVVPTAATPAKPKIRAPRKPGAPGHDHDHAASGSKNHVADSVDYLWKQSDAAFHEGDYPTAIKFHRAIVTLEPTDTESFGVGAWLLWSLGEKQNARAFIQQGLTANAKDAEMWNVAAQHYDLERAFPEAKNAYLKSVTLSGAKADELLRRRLAHSAEHAGDLALSFQTWKNLVRDFPNSPVNQNNLARVKGLQIPKVPVE